MLMGEMRQRMIDEYDNIITSMEYSESIHIIIACNDCDYKGEARFHPIGLKCGGCGGYNTVNKGVRESGDADQAAEE